MIDSTSASRIFAGLCIVIAVVITLTTSDQMVRVAAISGLAIVFYATRVVPEILTSLWCFLAFLAVSAAPTEVIFSGFAVGGFWLLVSGLIIGAAITQTGLGKLIASGIFQRTGGSYKRAVTVLALVGLGMGFLVPSTIPRVIVLVPIAVSLAKVMGFSEGSRPAIGLAVTAAISTLLPTYAILTANLPTIVHYGALETLYDLPPSYGGYLAEQWPVNLLRLGILLAAMLIFVGPTKTLDIKHEPPGAMTAPQKRLLGLMCIAIAFWASDAVHGISPAWVALTLASIMLLPGAGFLSNDAMKSSIDLSPAFFLAGVFAVSAVANDSGLNEAVATRLVPILRLGEGSDLRDLYAISGVSVVISHLTTAPAAPLVLAPLAEPLANAAGWPLETVAMAQIVGISTPLLPYQAPPLILAMALANIPMAAFLRFCLLLGIGVAIIGIPLMYFWWTWIGVL